MVVGFSLESVYSAIKNEVLPIVLSRNLIGALTLTPKVASWHLDHLILQNKTSIILTDVKGWGIILNRFVVITVESVILGKGLTIIMTIHARVGLCLILVQCLSWDIHRDGRGPPTGIVDIRIRHIPHEATKENWIDRFHMTLDTCNPNQPVNITTARRCVVLIHTPTIHNRFVQTSLIQVTQFLGSY